MKGVLAVLSVVVGVSQCQLPYGSYGGGGGFPQRHNNFPGRPGIFPGRPGGGGVGGGGPIKFPSSVAGSVHGKPGGVGGFGNAGGIGGAGIIGGFGGAVGGGQVQERPLSTQFCPAYISPLVHVSVSGSNYHFSWCADGGQKYVWEQAKNYCKKLGPGWSSVSIETPTENQFISSIIDKHGLPYIWTSGNRLGGGPKGWKWATGQPLTYNNWALTGFTPGKPQPDNQEDNNEQCLSVLNRFYPNDGITWHDVGCHHVKPTICEYTNVQSYVG
ncbi:pulmonary surfactant-associated protein D [Procambarus clarkii]|uniref:Mannose-binding protein n=1 Tax=Procambarus clarkii TaxID=6728 RepID=D0Q1I0_PROCL|nr:mannose-binding protein [Procambarus clarkii]